MPDAIALVFGSGCREARHEFLVFESFESKTRSDGSFSLVVIDVSHDIGLDHELIVACHLDLLVLPVGVEELVSLDVGIGDDKACQTKIEQTEEGCRNHIWTEQTVEAHTTCQHCNDLAVTSQLACEEDASHEDKQRTEKIGKIRNIVQVVLDNLPRRSLIGSKLVSLLLEIEHDGNAENQDNRKEIRAQKLLDYIPVNLFQCYSNQ